MEVRAGWCDQLEDHTVEKGVVEVVPSAEERSPGAP